MNIFRSSRSLFPRITQSNFRPKKMEISGNAANFTSYPITTVNKTTTIEVTINDDTINNTTNNNKSDLITKPNLSLAQNTSQNNFFRLAIIGSAGRKGTIKNMDINKYKRMKDCSKLIIDQLLTHYGRDITLYSGGAALSDHIAVDLFNDGYVKSLTIYSPCGWNREFDEIKQELRSAGYVDNGKYDWWENPGRTSNIYHREFSKQLNKFSLIEIDQAIAKGAKLDVSNGFHQRNSKIANCDFLIAFGFDSGSSPADGGTKDTWNKCIAQKVYYQIQ